MGYDRQYSREEIHQMLYESERRPRPGVSAGSAHSGHPISRHTEQREDLTDRPKLKQDSAFASRKSLVLAVEEALHSTLGQQQLATLNQHNVDDCKIVCQLSATLGKIKANAIINPTAVVGGKSVRAQGPGLYVAGVQVNSVFVLIVKNAAAASFAPLHIQTAYPQDVARS